jgi:hypothetical protein
VLPAVMSNACCQQPALCEDLLTCREHVLELHQEGDHALHQVLLHHRAHKLALGGRKEGRKEGSTCIIQQHCRQHSRTVLAAALSKLHAFVIPARHQGSTHLQQCCDTTLANTLPRKSWAVQLTSFTGDTQTYLGTSHLLCCLGGLPCTSRGTRPCHQQCVLISGGHTGGVHLWMWWQHSQVSNLTGPVSNYTGT